MLSLLRDNDDTKTLRNTTLKQHLWHRQGKHGSWKLRNDKLVYSSSDRRFRNLRSKAIYSAIESWYQRKVCSHYGLWLWLRSRNCHSTGRDGSSCASDLFNERGRTEFKIGDERQTENIPDGCDKLAANQRRLRGGQTTNSLWLRYLQIYSNLINIKI